MKPEDETELHRLTEQLREVGLNSQITPGQMEALKKAAFALSHTFIAGHRSEIEDLYANPPLTKDELQKLKTMGIDPQLSD